jgi:tRNA-splicing ligase RtcB
VGLSKRLRQEQRSARLAEDRRAKRADKQSTRRLVAAHLGGEQVDDWAPAARVPRPARPAHPASPHPASVAVKAVAAPIEFVRTGPVLWQVPLDARPGMRVPGVVVADDALLREMAREGAIEQLVAAARLPGAVGALAMPDCHSGYGLPVGGVAAVRAADGVISVGGIGHDINCGVRLLTSDLEEPDLLRRQQQVADALAEHVPTERGTTRLTRDGVRDVLIEGAGWAVARGYGLARDLERAESSGCMPGADPDAVSRRAIERGLRQAGSPGSGNHFTEVQVVAEILDAEVADAFGLRLGQVCAMVHTGSRGLGHEVCRDYGEQVGEAIRRGEVEDVGLLSVPFRSALGQRYFGAMQGAANYAFANRQLLAHQVRAAFQSVFGRATTLEALYDVTHNIARLEEHRVHGELTPVLVHRKGATRAFPAGHPDVPACYRTVGHPVLIPGDMGRASYVAVGTDEAMAITFGSVCHGAGRRLSRTDARTLLHRRDPRAELAAAGVMVRTPNPGGLAEEAPDAYKDVADVVAVCAQAAIVRPVVRLRPRVVVKG